MPRISTLSRRQKENRMKIKITGKLEVVASAPLKAYGTDEQQVDKTTGKPLFEVAYKAKQITKIGDQEVESDVVEKVKSLVNLPKGEHEVELAQFHMTDKGSSQVKTYNRIINVKGQTKKAA